MKRTLPAALALACLLLNAGCAGYRLGSMLPNDVRTVHVPTCINQTAEPLIEQDATRAILSQIQIDGTLRIASEDQASSILQITLLNFWLDPVSYARGEVATANQYRMRIEASFVMYRKADQSVVVEVPSVVGWYDFEFTGDMTSSKAVALRPAAEDLGRRILSRIVQYWP
jgi:hypothetical protein